MIILEACVDALEKAISAEQKGAHRLELCANLHLDGTTPDTALIRKVLNAVKIPVKVMIRPRSGDFVYSDEELQQMLISIQECKSLGVHGVVTGALHDDSTLDLQYTEVLSRVADPLPVTIHKCIDLAPDIFKAIDDLKKIRGVTSVLSSGQAVTAWEGREILKQMHTACGSRLTLIVAGKVTVANQPHLAKIIGATEYHGRRLP